MLLLVGLFAVCLGWHTERTRWHSDRQHMEFEHQDREKKIFASSAASAEARAILSLLDKLEDTADHLQFIQNERVFQLMEIARHQKDIDFAAKFTACKYTQNARAISLGVLNDLSCADERDFFAIARSIENFGDNYYYRATHDTNSLEHKSLNQFVEKLVGSPNQRESYRFLSEETHLF